MSWGFGEKECLEGRMNNGSSRQRPLPRPSLVICSVMGWNILFASPTVIVHAQGRRLSQTGHGQGTHDHLPSLLWLWPVPPIFQLAAPFLAMARGLEAGGDAFHSPKQGHAMHPIKLLPAAQFLLFRRISPAYDACLRRVCFCLVSELLHRYASFWS